MPPQMVILIRHGEKPVPHGPQGFTHEGRPDPHSLIAAGWQRAGALIRFFNPSGDGPAPSGLPRPSHVMAARHDPAKDSDTRRPKQTVHGLARSLGVPLDDRFAKGQEAALAADLQTRDGCVLVCWAHELIADILTAMGLPRADIPAWPEDRFDLVWTLTPKAAGWDFRQRPQMLMPGDRPDLPQPKAPDVPDPRS